MTTATATAVKFHLALHVADLARAARFYRALLGAEPVKESADQARFEVDDPPLVLALIPNAQPAGGTLNHIGFRMPDSDSLVEAQRRLEEAGMPTQRQEGVECCYARQTKFWVTDPDGNLCEIYTFEEDLDHSGFDDPPAKSPPRAPEAQVIWQHRLTDTVPERIDHADGSVDRVHFEGTFNAALQPGRLSHLLAEARRILRPDGKVDVHGMVGDRPFPGVPAFPGLASLVQHVPTAAEVVTALEQAGFRDVYFEKLHDVCCIQADGVKLQEARLIACRPGSSVAERSCQVVYKGPLDRVVDDEGTVYMRGRPVAVSAAELERLKVGVAAEQFVFSTP
jgi:catechol 2,3-dioxygenase-like lactoylglutathione lyase family enzyme